MNDWFALIESHMRTQPGRAALVMENRIASYGMLQSGIDRCARRIAGLNLAREVPIGVLHQDSIRHLILCLALHRIGIPSISLSPNHSGIKSLKLGAVLGDADAKSAGFPGARLVEITDEWFAIDTPDDEAVLPQGFTNNDQVCRLCLTSGTTGEPKLVALTIENIERRSQMYTSADWKVILNLPGLVTTFGFIPSCAALAAGRTLCFAQSPYQAARMIDLFAVDFVNAATEQLIALTRVARKNNTRFGTLRTVQVGGSMPTRAMLEAATVHVCHDIQNRYAGTELGSMARASAQEILNNPGLGGHIEPGVAIGIFDDRGTRCADGKSGHVKARYEDAEAWIDVGDIGWIAPEKKLFIVGRSADGTGGNQISPVHEIEHLVRLEWDMADAGAVLASDASPGAKPQIWVATVENKDASAEKLEAIAQTRGIDCAIKLFDLKAIPRTANGKINRAALKTALLAVDSSSKH